MLCHVRGWMERGDVQRVRADGTMCEGGLVAWTVPVGGVSAHATRSPRAKRRVLRERSGMARSVNQSASARWPKQHSVKISSSESRGAETSRASGGSTLTTYATTVRPVGSSGSRSFTACTVPLAHLRSPPTLHMTRSPFWKRSFVSTFASMSPTILPTSDVRLRHTASEMVRSA
jgi:hypothetical protein